MLYTNYSKEILGLQDAEVEKVCEIEKRIEITVKLKRKVHICPFCGRKTEKIHDYQTQRIKDLPAFGKPVVVILRKRRYDCECGKNFFVFLKRKSHRYFASLHTDVILINLYFIIFTPTIDNEPENPRGRFQLLDKRE